MKIFVDIDDTVCYIEAGEDKTNYELAKPFSDRIQKINNLFDEGHEIIYWTARGCLSGIDWAELTVSQLNLWGCKFTKVMMGKPHYDVFICDKAINSLEFFKENAT